MPRRFKSDRDEIRQNCSSNKYASLAELDQANGNYFLTGGGGQNHEDHISKGPLKCSYGVSGSALSSQAGFGPQPQPKSNLVHFSLKIWHLVATILMILQRINWPVYQKIFVSKISGVKIPCLTQVNFRGSNGSRPWVAGTYSNRCTDKRPPDKRPPDKRPLKMPTPDKRPPGQKTTWTKDHQAGISLDKW